MSSDNRLCKMRYRWGWYVWNGSGSMNYDQPPDHAHCFETEDEANAYMRTRSDDYFEYGHQVIGVDEQRAALREIIEDATARLEMLERTGQQWEDVI